MNETALSGELGVLYLEINGTIHDELLLSTSTSSFK